MPTQKVNSFNNIQSIDTRVQEKEGDTNKYMK